MTTNKDAYSLLDFKTYLKKKSIQSTNMLIMSSVSLKHILLNCALRNFY